MRYFSSIITVVAMIMAISCTSSKNAQSDARDEIYEGDRIIVPDTFVLPKIPGTLTNPDERAKYLVSHYWERFDFADNTLIQRPEITEQAFVDYINLLDYVTKEVADASFVYTLSKAQADTAMYRHFVSLFEKYFYEPNSPFRNDEYYLKVLQETAGSPLLTDEIKSRYRFQLDMAMKNRIGQKANNINFTTVSGQTLRLYDLRSEYTLLMFTNPGCHACEAVTSRLNMSKALNDALALNNQLRTMLTILTVYPENDPDRWCDHLTELPGGWIHGYDKGMEINRERLYDIKAYPTLYLLDRNKRVILKDTSIEAIETFFSVKM
ncbi:DUF5106 domain-containing protein [Proteiniphilum sp. UBA5280]|nr:DUF5106 domain-containing protein [Proteiniphilum sp. UBA5280]